MSQNSDTKEIDIVENNTKKQMRINKKYIIAFGITIVIAAIVGGAILFRNDNNVHEDPKDEESNLLVDDNDTYEGLNYTQIKEKIADIGFFYNYSKNLEGSKIEVSYIKVEGFKDSALEERVNKTLYDAAQELNDNSLAQNPKVLYNHVYNVTDVYIFNNVLSTMYCKEECDVDGNTKFEYKSVNINLKEYKDFSIEDVFIKDTNIEEILKANGISNTQDLVFSVSPKILYVADGETIKKISLYENKDKIAIYKRFNENKKMFSKTYNASPYCYTTKKFFETDVYGLEKDNIFIDTCNTIVDKDIPDGVKESAKELYKEAINNARSVAYSNTSKRYLIQIVLKAKKEEKNYNIEVEYKLYEIKKDFFTNKIEDFIVATENKKKDEIIIPDYFNDTVLDGAGSLLSMESETLKKEVDEQGIEIKNNKNTNNVINGVS